MLLSGDDNSNDPAVTLLIGACVFHLITFNSTGRSLDAPTKSHFNLVKLARPAEVKPVARGGSSTLRC